MWFEQMCMSNVEHRFVIIFVITSLICNEDCPDLLQLLFQFVIAKLLQFLINPEAATGGVLWIIVFWEISQNSQEINYAKFPKFSELCKIFKNTFLTEHLWTTASVNLPRLVITSPVKIESVFSFTDLNW